MEAVTFSEEDGHKWPTNINKALRWIVFGNEENPLPKSEQRTLLLVGAVFGAIMAFSFIV